MRRPHDPTTVLMDLFLDLEPEELALTDPERLGLARAHAPNPRTLSIWGDEMTWGLYALRREGLERRLATLIEIGETPADLIEQMTGWTDDEVRAWIARHEHDMTNGTVAKGRSPSRASA